MISLTTLLASATVAAAAKKVEDVPAPGIVDTILGFVPSWLGGPVAQVFDKGVETLGVVLGWATATPQVVADVVTWGADTAMSFLLALARGGADKSAAEAIAWTLGTALGLKYVAARA